MFRTDNEVADAKYIIYYPPGVSDFDGEKNISNDKIAAMLIESKSFLEVQEIINNFSDKWLVKLDSVVNYEALLRKYINHIGQCEGTEFIRDLDETEFSKDEINALKRLAEETMNV